MEREQKIEQEDKLVDSFGRVHDYLRLSLTDRCNLRCNYCMPQSPLFMPKHKLLNASEIDQLIAVFVSLGIKKIRLTGGEPLLRPDFSEIVKAISPYNIPLHLTTNATRVHEYADLIATHFSSLNMSLDTLRSERFKMITQRNEFKNTITNLDKILNLNIPVKINVVIIRDVNHDEIVDFIKLTTQHNIEVRFIEFMPFKGNGWNHRKSYSQHEMLKQIKSQYPIVSFGREHQQTAMRYQVENAPGSFGIISTVSHPFCEECNRIRITADGKLKNCLFSVKEFDLRPLLHSGKDLKHNILEAIKAKKVQYGGNLPMQSLQNTNSYFDNRSMTSIGG